MLKSDRSICDSHATYCLIFGYLRFPGHKCSGLHFQFEKCIHNVFILDLDHTCLQKIFESVFILVAKFFS